MLSIFKKGLMMCGGSVFNIINSVYVVDGTPLALLKEKPFIEINKTHNTQINRAKTLSSN